MNGEKASYDVSNRHVQRVFMQTENSVSDAESNGYVDEDSISSSLSSDIQEDDDATSSLTSTSTSTSSISGPLYELSELMDHLPIKRGLSNFFKGKSQSFTSLASVKSVEDLAKKEYPYKKRSVKPCNKYRPKGLIAKKYCSRSSKLIGLNLPCCSPDRSYCICGPTIKGVANDDFYKTKSSLDFGVQVVPEAGRRPLATKLTGKAVLAAAATDSAACHRDSILSPASVKLNQRLLISSSRDVAIKVWK